MKVKIVLFGSLENANATSDALSKADTGQISRYHYCHYSVAAKGQFISSENANPRVGQSGVAEIVVEERIKVECNRSNAKTFIKAKSTHPYEEVGFDIYPLLEESEL